MSTEPREGELPGSVRPQRRLPVNPGALAWALPRARAAFPLATPSWPTTLERPPQPSRLGVDYETDWARRYPARAVRAVLTEAVTRPLISAIAAPEVTGDDRIAHLDGPVIFAANHASHLDTPLLLSVLPSRWRHRTVVAAGADYFFDTRLKAAAFALTINAIPIERIRVGRDSADRAAAVLRAGWSLLIYPEGGRSPDGWGQAHRAGAAWLAQRSGFPVVPIHLEGTRQILPRHGRRLRPGSTRVTFGRPLVPEPGGDPRRLADRLEQTIAALADERTTDWWTATRRAARRTSPALTGPGDAGAWRRSWALGERGRRAPTERTWPRP